MKNKVTPLSILSKTKLTLIVLITIAIFHIYASFRPVLYMLYHKFDIKWYLSIFYEDSFIVKYPHYQNFSRCYAVNKWFVITTTIIITFLFLYENGKNFKHNNKYRFLILFLSILFLVLVIISTLGSLYYCWDWWSSESV